MAEEIEDIFEKVIEKANEKIEDKFRVQNIEKQKQAEIEAEEVGKKTAIDTKKIQDEQNVQFFYDMYFELLGDINAMMFLVSKGKLGRNLFKNLDEMIAKLRDLKIKLSRMNINVDSVQRGSMLNTKRKLDSVITTQVIPTSTRDRNKMKRFVEKYNK